MKWVGLNGRVPWPYWQKVFKYCGEIQCQGDLKLLSLIVLGCTCTWYSNQNIWLAFDMFRTLFNIVDTWLKKKIELWCLCCTMMFRWINKQPGIQKFWNWCSHYQDIYDWISPLNKPSGRSGLWFILTQQSMGQNENGKSGHLSIFTSLFKAFDNAFEVHFFRASFLHVIKDTNSIHVYKAMQLRF